MDPGSNQESDSLTHQQSASSTSGASTSDSLASTSGSSQSWGTSTNDSLTTGATHSVTNTAGAASTTGLSGSMGETTGNAVSASQSTGLTQGVGHTITGTEGSSVGLTQGASQGVTQSTTASTTATEGVARGVSQSATQGVGQSTTQGTQQSLSEQQSDNVGSNWGMSGSLAIAPMVSYSVSKPWYEENKRVLAGYLQVQVSRLQMALVEQGWQATMFLLTPDEETKTVAARAARQAFWGPTSTGPLPSPFEVFSSLPPHEERHLLEHARTFSACTVREPLPMSLERYHYSTFLTSTELAVVTHPPRIDLPGIQVQFDPIPPFRVPVDHEGDIPLGRLWNPERREVTRYTWGLRRSQLGHLFVVGAAGSGKTTTATTIFSRFVNQPPVKVVGRTRSGAIEERTVPFGALVLDWKSTWRGILPLMPKERFRFGSLWDARFGFTYNPLEVPDDIDPGVHLDSFCEAFALALGLGQRGRGLIRRALSQLYQRQRPAYWVKPDAPRDQVANVMQLPRLSRFIGLADLYDEISRMVENAQKDRRVSNSEREGLQVVQMRLQNFAHGERMARIYTRDVHEDELANPVVREYLEMGEVVPEGCLRLSDLIGDGSVTLLEGGPLDPAVKKAIVTALATSIFTWARVKGKGAFTPERLIVLEEAHEVMTSSADSAAEIGGLTSTIWEQMWNEGREYGLRLMAIAQIPTALPPSVIANSTTKLVHKLETGPDQSAMMVALGKDERVDHRPYKRFLGNMSPGMCIARSHASGVYEDADPVLVRPDMLPLGQPSDEELRHYAIRR